MAEVRLGPLGHFKNAPIVGNSVVTLQHSLDIFSFIFMFYFGVCMCVCE